MRRSDFALRAVVSDHPLARSALHHPPSANGRSGGCTGRKSGSLVTHRVVDNHKSCTEKLVLGDLKLSKNRTNFVDFCRFEIGRLQINNVIGDAGQIPGSCSFACRADGGAGSGSSKRSLAPVRWVGE